MTLRIGAPAEGQDFFDRTIERAHLWRTLPGNHVVLSAPRRVGKTSLLKQLVREAPEHGLLGVYLDVSRRESASDLLAAISEALPERSIAAHVAGFTQATSRWMSRLEKIKIDVGGLGGLELEARGAGATTWQESYELLQKRLSPRPVLIVLDEFSVFIQGLLNQRPGEAKRLLLALRTWRQLDGVACRFIFSGSVGLNRLLERHGLQTETNDCDDYALGPFALADAVTMAITLAAREDWPLAENLAQDLCAKVGWLSPFYIVTALEEAVRAAMFRSNVVGPSGEGLTQADIDKAFEQLLNTRSKFNHWNLRLNDHFDAATLPWVREVLARLSARPQGLKESTLCNVKGHPPQPQEALLLLEEHGYIVQDGQSVLFQSPLLRQYWKKNHGK